MASKMANWIAHQERHLSPEEFARWKTADVKVRAYLAKQERIPAAVRALDNLNRDIGKKAILPALQKASEFLAQIEKASAPQSTGTLRQSIGSTRAKLLGDASRFCGWVASGPRRGFARAVSLEQTKSGAGYRVKRHSKKSTFGANQSNRIQNPVVYARYVKGGHKAIVAGQGGSGKKALVSWQGQFFGRKVKAAPPKDFMAPAVAQKDQAANVATTEINTNLQTMLP